jgi:DNA-binding transcriptional LysR family regulator
LTSRLAGGTGRSWTCAFAAAGLDRQVPFEVADFAAAVGLVRNGLGIAFLPASVAAQWPDLATVEITGYALLWRISVATPAHRRMSAAARAFLAELIRDEWLITPADDRARKRASPS